MAATTPLLAGLLKKATITDHDEMLKAASAALTKSKGDQQAQLVKLVALLKLERYDEALKHLEESGSTLKERATVEHAYALYKSGQWQKAADVASQASDRGARHLEAQAQYQLENSARVLDIYNELKQQNVADEEFDIKVNVGGAQAQSQWLNGPLPQRPSSEDLQQFETAYNAACGSVARGEYAQAEILLKRAHELCKHHEELSEEEKQEELVPIMTQQLYVLHVQGKSPEADSLAEAISTDATGDVATQTVLQSNLLATSSRPSNPFLAHRAFNSTPSLTSKDRLFSYQVTPLASNRKTIDLQAFKFKGLAAASKKHDVATVDPEAILSSTFSAAARAENQVSKAAITKVEAEVSRRPKDVGLVLTLVQMQMLTGNTTSAIQSLESLLAQLADSAEESEKAVRFNPGLVSILVGLYRGLGRKASIKEELGRSATYWRTRSHPPPTLLRAAGSSLLESLHPQDSEAAADMFTKFREQQPDNKAAIAGYVASHADQGESIASEADKLSSVSDLTRNIDVDALEAAGIPQPSNALHIAQLNRPKKRGADGTSSQPKRIRKNKLPKDYDATKTADPERWLPMKDRSYYRAPKSKKNKKKGGGDTQGGAVNESLNIDAKPSGNAPANANSGGGGRGGKKKKGKR
jgi:signal recognition particle subunit SRP72